MTQVTSPAGRAHAAGRLGAVAAVAAVAHGPAPRKSDMSDFSGISGTAIFGPRTDPPETDFSASAETFFSASACKIFSNFFEKFFGKFLKISNFFKFQISIFSPETFFSANTSAMAETGSSASASGE